MSSEHPLARASAAAHTRQCVLAIALLLCGAAACSSDQGHRDQNYGTDVGAGYVLPDGGSRGDSAGVEVVGVGDVRADATTPDAGVDAGEDTGSGVDTGD